MSSLLPFFASTVPVSVPDVGSTGLLLGLGVLAVGVVARVIKNKKR